MFVWRAELPSFLVTELPSYRVSKFPSLQGREGGRTNERPGSDHLISGPMRGLGKNCPNGADRHTHSQTDGHSDSNTVKVNVSCQPCVQIFFFSFITISDITCNKNIIISRRPCHCVLIDFLNFLSFKTSSEKPSLAGHVF